MTKPRPYSSKLPQRSYLLRSVGLELLALIGYGRSQHETAKPVLLASWTTALSHAAVHLIPSLTSIAIITINLRNLYLGRTLPGPILSITISTALLQVAAKAQELLIVASLASIVIHTIQQEMMGSKGVPLGVIGGTFLFSSISYFWSPEFWGAICSKDQPWKRPKLYGLLVLSGLLAMLVGPSTAVLIVPRDRPWAAGGASMYLRGSPQEMWPETLSELEPEIQTLCSSANATQYPICPSGGYLAMLDFARTRFPVRNLGSLDVNNGSTVVQYGKQNLNIPSDFALAPMMTLNGNYRALACETTMTGTHLSEAMIMTKLLDDWYRAVMSIPYSPGSSASEYKWFETLQMQVASQIPAVRAACSAAQNVSSGDTTIHFPVLPSLGCWTGENAEIAYDSLNQSSSTGIRTTWVDLPPKFGVVSTGFVLEAPWDETSDTRAIVGCSIDARWTNGTISTEMGSTILSGQPDIINRGFFGTTTQTAEVGQPANFSEFRAVPGDAWRSISLKGDWLDALTPQVADLSGDGTTASINLILQQSGITDASVLQSTSIPADEWNDISASGLNRTVTLEWILAHLVTDGLSRHHSFSTLSTSGPMSEWSLLDYDRGPNFYEELLSGGSPLIPPNASLFMTEHATISIGGLSYQANELTDYLSIATLLVYTLLALSHTLTLIITRQSSSSWDSVTDLLALAYVSRPDPMALRNSGAGIRELKTYGQRAVIRAAHSDATDHGTDHPQAQIVFLDEHEEVELRDLIRDEPYASVYGSRTSLGSVATLATQRGVGYSSAVQMHRVQSDTLYS